MHTRKGFTLIEILIVIAILAVLVTIIVSTFSLFNKNEAIKKDTETVVEVLQQARSQTLSSKNGSQYGVHFGTSKITLFTGATYSAGASTNSDTTLASTDTIVTVTLTGGGNDIVFTRLTGETAQNGTVVVSSPTSSRTKTVTIYKTGVIESN